MDKSIKNTGVMEGNFNTGNHVNQTLTINTDIEQAFNELYEEINKLEDSTLRAQMEINADLLKKSIENNDVSTGKKVISLLNSTLGGISSLITIASFIGVTL